ncbi:alpha-mannosidase [Paenibacillus silvae]|uniref:alpha-mannosidase n=1 Tax=Paenibacillus silvae TaxID=1325358 RepID=UPI0020059859|nr:alpha-mannosidase [Paenibacillus silvae]MCK6073595.1 alpha-mannosidase [Paenibacillus silvae]MCK6148929.1 alpha-mannosidase [Paenibacillus silvae]MCK6267228.1 alpha-mannosidase [Paenibacillus silvae]
MTNQKTAHLISHTHWDREWYMPYEHHHVLLVELMDKLLDTLDQDPEYRYFHLDGQTIIREDYLQVRPDQQERLDRYIREGRIQFGPWYVLQDEFLTSSEANLRNLLIGHRDAKPFGVISKTGYFPDSFGNMGQAPQILQQADIQNAIFGRGVKPTGFNNAVVDAEAYESPYSEMIWRSPDGSEVLGILFANWYCNGMEVPVDPEQAKVYWDKNLQDAEKFASTPHLLFMNGCDHQPIQTDLPAALRTASELYPDVKFIHSNFDDYIEAVSRHVPDNLATIEGELRSQHTDGWGTLVNTASARVYLKQLNQHGQTLLEKVAEPLAAMAHAAGVKSYPHHLLTHAWKMLMQNHPHDSICGCSVDEVHREMVTRFAKSRQLAEKLVSQTAQAIGESIDVQQSEAWGEDAVLFTVLNTAGWTRNGIIEQELSVDKAFFPEGPNPQALARTLEEAALPAYQIVDSEGNLYEAEIVDLGVHFGYELPKDRFRQPYMARKVKVTFRAKQVPALGYQTYGLVPAREQESDSVHAVQAEENVMENQYLRVTVEDNGTVTLLDKRSGKEYVGLNAYENTGDIGNEYVYRQPEGEQAITTEHLKAELRLVQHSPYRAVIQSVLHWNIPAGADELFEQEKRYMVPFTERKAQRVQQTVPLKITTTYTLEAGCDLLKVRTDFDNQATDHRLRALFPSGLVTDSHYADSIFEVAKRPNAPAKEWVNPSNAQHQQAFVYVTDGSTGLMAANKGLNEYEILQTSSGSSIAVTLLRASSELGDWGVFETPEAQCQGPQSVEYAIIPFAGDAAKSGACASAYMYPIPWTTVQLGTLAHTYAKEAQPVDGMNGEEVTLPPCKQWLDWNSERSTLAFSTFKIAEETGDVIARWFNLTADRAELKVQTGFECTAAYESDVLERVKDTLEEMSQTVSGHKIVTQGYQLR